MSTKKPSVKSSKKSSRFVFRLKVLFCLIVTGGVLFLCNWLYHAYKKPAEVVGLFDGAFHKSPHETWREYKSVFRTKATSILTPDLLAALAQAETNGNPIARTYWRWQWTTEWHKLYAPASSASGLLQITQATYGEARKFCIHEGRVYHEATPEGREVCWANVFYSRLVPSHAIEMTSARLHFLTERLVAPLKGSKVSLRNKQDLATIIHLCGYRKGQLFAQARFQSRRVGNCGDHNVSRYLQRVRNLQKSFQQLARHDQGQL